MKTVQKALLVCGIAAPVLYIGTDILAAGLYKGYSYVNQQVSELSAIGAPTAPLWNVMMRIYGLLAIAFGIGVWLSANEKRSQRITGILIVSGTVIGQLWPPMHQRGTADLSAGITTDTLHLVFAGPVVLFMTLFIAFGSGASGTGFRIYSIATIVAMLACGALVSTQVPAIAAGQPTPGYGLVERVSVYSPLVWMVALAVVLLRGEKKQDGDTKSN